MSTVFVGNLEPGVTPRELEREFDRYGRIRDCWVARNPPGFAFITYDDDRDARDAVRDMDDRHFLGRRIRVEISKRDRRGGRDERPRRGPPERTDHRVTITGVPRDSNWRLVCHWYIFNWTFKHSFIDLFCCMCVCVCVWFRDLKDWLREVAEPLYADIKGDEAVAEFRSAEDIERIISKLDDQKFKGSYVRISAAKVEAPSSSRARSASPARRSRSRSDSRDRRSRDRSGSRERRADDKNDDSRGSRRDRSESR